MNAYDSPQNTSEQTDLLKPDAGSDAARAEQSNLQGIDLNNAQHDDANVEAPTPGAQEERGDRLSDRQITIANLSAG